MPVRAVFFDLGGTLLMMRRDRVFQLALAELGREADAGAIHKAFAESEGWWLATYSSVRLSAEETVEAYRRLEERVYTRLYPGSSQEEARDASALVRKKWASVDAIVAPELYPDAEPALRGLAERGYHLGLISNATADVAGLVKALGLERYLKTVVISGVVGFSKPGREIFDIALRRAGVAPAEAVHVGDIFEADVLGARNAGMSGILIVRAGGAIRQDCVCVESLADIEGHL